MGRALGDHARWSGGRAACWLGLAVLATARCLAHTPHDPITDVQPSPAFARDGTVLAIVFGELKRSVDGGLTWEPLHTGLDNASGFRALAVAAQPAAAPIVYATTAGSGLYESHDGGASWSHAGGDLPTRALGSIAVSRDSSDQPIVLVAGREGGLFRSPDGGRSWSTVLTTETQVEALALGARQVFAGTADGRLLRSPDGGQRFLEVGWPPNPDAGRVTALAEDGAGEGRWFVGTDRGRLYRSDDDGRSFAALPVPVDRGAGPGETAAITSVAAVAGRRPLVCATTARVAALCSTDGGRSWAERNSGLRRDAQAIQERKPHFRTVRISPAFADDGTVFVGGFAGLFRSVDAGMTWEEVETRTARAVTGISIARADPNGLRIGIATYDTGVVVSDDGGASWSIRNHGLRDTHVWDLHLFSGGGPFDAIALTNAAIYRLARDSLAWTAGGDDTGSGTSLARRVLSAVSRRVFRSSAVASPPFPTVLRSGPAFSREAMLFLGSRRNGVFASHDGGRSWAPLWSAPGWITDLAISPTFPEDRFMLAALLSRGVWASSDGGGSWAPLGVEGLATGVDPTWWPSPRIALSPAWTRDRTAFVGSPAGLFRTDDGGRRWVRVDGIASGGSPYVAAIAVSPEFERDRLVLAAIKGHGLWRSLDGGRTFHLLPPHAGPASPYGLRRLEFSPRYGEDGVLFGIAGDEIVRSADRGERWTVVPRPVRYEEHHQHIAYRGAWEAIDDDTSSGGGARLSRSAGARATFRFRGRSVRVLSRREPMGGRASILVDGMLREAIDARGERDAALEVTVRDLPDASHVLVVEVGGPNASDTRAGSVRLDAIDVLP